MRPNREWTIGKKLMASFFLVSAITAGLGFVGFHAVSRGGEAIEEIGAVRLPSVDSLLKIKEGAENIRGTMRTLGIAGLPAEIRRRQYQNLEKAREQCQAAWEVYTPLPQQPNEAEIWQQFVPAWERWKKENDTALQYSHTFDELLIANPTVLQEQLQEASRERLEIHRRLDQTREHRQAAD